MTETLNMFLLKKPIGIIETEKILVEVFRITKLSNQKAMIGVTNEDLEYLAANLAEEYLSVDLMQGLNLLRVALTQYTARSKSEENVEIGDFTRICYSLRNQNQEETKSKALLNLEPLNNDLAKEHLSNIKKMLGRALKKIPQEPSN